MELQQKVAALPASPGVYLFKDVLDSIIYVGKAKSLRSRVRSYFLESRWQDAKTGSLAREISDVDHIVVDNDKEALALENHLVKLHKPKFNVLLRDDKTYPFIRFTAREKFPRVYVTRRLVKDGSLYFGPYFPHSLAHRLVHLIHKRFLVPSCRVDLTRAHPRPCLQYYIKRCLGPCVPGLVSDARYAEAARDVRMFLDGRRSDLLVSIEQRMTRASGDERFEEAAGYRDILRTLREFEEKQKIAAAEGDDTDVLAWYAEPPLVAVNLFHIRRGRVLDRRDFYWEDLQEFQPPEFLSALLKQLYLESGYLPRYIHVPLEFEDHEPLEELLGERAGRRLEILSPLRGTKRAFLDLVERNARQSFEQRFRVQQPGAQAIAEALETTLGLPEAPKRIECFDISHFQGADTVASLVVWQDGRMLKSAYRKFIIRGEHGNDDFSSLREAVERRYARVQAAHGALPGLVLIDGGIGQLHAAAAALEKLQIINLPLASIAKREETIYVHGQEHDPLRLDRHSPILRLVQQIRDETHRFAVTFHRHRRAAARIRSRLLDIPGVGPRTTAKLLRKFGSLANLRRASLEDLRRAVSRAYAQRIFDFLRAPPAP